LNTVVAEKPQELRKEKKGYSQIGKAATLAQQMN
jgi:hypothetical protein